MNAISVIVPTLNEVDNIAMLIERIAAGFETSKTTYEILFVDDNSIDGTRAVIKSFAEKYPVKVVLKKGPRGKAHSLLEGFDAAQYDLLCMIDADLQYPPEAIVPMHQLMVSSGTDIVLTNRQEHGTSILRKVTSAGFNFIFTKMMFGFDYDSQSGLKLFKRRVINSISLDPTPWSFDLEFIVRSLEKNYKIVSYDITFAERYSGVAKIQVGKVAYELAKASVKLRLNSSPSKVKSAYKTSNSIAKKTIMASLALFTLLGYSAFVDPPPALSLEISSTNTLTNLLPDTNDDGDTADTNISADIDISEPARSDLTTTKGTAPTTTVTPILAPATYTPLAVQQPTAPKITAQPRQPATNRSSAPATASQQLATRSSRINSVGRNNDQQSVASSTTPLAITAAAPTPDLITYPDGTKKTGGFSYANDEPNGAAGLVKPLSIAALLIVIASIGSYLFFTQAKHIKIYGNSQAVKG